ncbi:MAG: hypothetical protein ACP5P4_08105 [Steroidobacteraceae bacterium]
MSFTARQAGELYRIDKFVDYEREDGNWLLLGAGSGLMMSIMDLEPRHRYCIDTDILTPEEWDRMPDWLTLMEGCCDRINACGWFSRYENGLRMLKLLRGLKRRPTVYFGAYERPDLLEPFDVAGGIEDFIIRLRGPVPPGVELWGRSKGASEVPDPEFAVHRNRVSERDNVLKQKVPRIRRAPGAQARRG